MSVTSLNTQRNSRAVGEEGLGTEGDLNGKMVSSR
jgi:hypothetical protein